MPELIKHVDAIARSRACDVLYLEFHPLDHGLRRAYQYQQDEVRRKLLAWFDAHGYGWQRCGPIANASTLSSYRGEVCLDIAFDETLPKYTELRDHLEFPDGNMRIPGVRFYHLPLQLAMKNAAHDDPDFWKRWAEQF